MSISISNIAWDVVEDEQIFEILKANNISKIDIAYSKYFPNIDDATDDAILNVKKWWTDRGFSIVGMQSLLFGTTGLNVFGSEDVQQALLVHLDKVCHIGDLLGARRLVFGSPKNRDCSGLSSQETQKISTALFRQLGDIAQKHNVVICLEPNPTVYSANFMTTSEETLGVVKQINHPAIKMQLDTGAILINEEEPFSLLEKARDYIGHIHISEPSLAVIGDVSESDHQALAQAIEQYLPNMTKAIEMVATKEESHLESVKRAVDFVVKIYEDKQ